MATVLHPWQILVAAMAGWITRQQDAVIDYLREENRVLKEQLGRKRLRLTDQQRRRLAVRGKAIGRRALSEVASLVTPDTILRWHRQLVARKWTYKRRSSGRPRVMEVIADLVVRMARENRGWGYTRIQGALQNIGHRVGRTTISNIFKDNGIDPAPERDKQTTWSQFLKAHWNATREYAAHYHRERNHQGIDNRLIEPGNRVESASSTIACGQRLGGMLRFYHRAAA
jgi:putative transposase